MHYEDLGLKERQLAAGVSSVEQHPRNSTGFTTCICRRSPFKKKTNPSIWEMKRPGRHQMWTQNEGLMAFKMWQFAIDSAAGYSNPNTLKTSDCEFDSRSILRYFVVYSVCRPCVLLGDMTSFERLCTHDNVLSHGDIYGYFGNPFAAFIPASFSSTSFSNLSYAAFITSRIFANSSSVTLYWGLKMAWSPFLPSTVPDPG